MHYFAVTSMKLHIIFNIDNFDHHNCCGIPTEKQRNEAIKDNILQNEVHNFPIVSMEFINILY